MSIAAQCPNCGAPIAFHVSSSVVIVCDHCRTVVARTDRTLEDIGKTSDLVATQSPLTLWMSGTYRGIGFQLTGRAQLEHGAGGIWDEWYMALDDGRWGWLAEAQGRFYLTFEQPSAGAIDLEHLVPGYSVLVGEPAVSMAVAETGEARLLGGRGEIPYRFQPGEHYAYADLSGPDGMFGTLDFSEDPPKLFMGREVTLAELGLSGLAPAEDHERGPGPSVESVRCENCGGSLELHAPDRTERVACPYCGAMHDCNHGVLQFLKVLQPQKVKPALPLGCQGTFEGQTFTLIGFMRRSTSAGWQVFEWDEYLLYNPAAGFRWLACNEGHWNYLKPVPLGELRARVPGSRHYAGEIAEYGGKNYKIFQSGTAEVVYVAGEFYWKVEAGQTSMTADYVNPPEMLAGESTDSEINWTLGTYMTPKEIAACFPDVPAPTDKPWGIAPNEPYRHKGVYVAWGVLFALAVAGLFWASGRANNHHVFAQSFELAPQPAADADPQVFFSEPFALEGGQNLEIKAHGGQVDNSWLYVQADLYNQDTGQVYDFDIPIEYYHGYADGESWSEGSRTRSRYLSAVPRGTYTLRLAVERSDFGRASTLHISVIQGVFRFMYWLIAFAGMSLIPLCVLIHHVWFERRRWVESDFGGGDE